MHARDDAIAAVRCTAAATPTIDRSGRWPDMAVRIEH